MAYGVVPQGPRRISTLAIRIGSGCWALGLELGSAEPQAVTAANKAPKPSPQKPNPRLDMTAAYDPRVRAFGRGIIAPCHPSTN